MAERRAAGKRAAIESRRVAGYCRGMAIPARRRDGRRRGSVAGPRRRLGRSPPRRALRIGLIALAALAALAALPIVLVPVYAVAPPPASTLEMWQRLNGIAIDKRWVDLDDIAPALAHAVIMAEDGQFCSHRGIDWGELRAVVSAPSGPRRGASTIPMQTAKNLFLWPSRSYVRKALEIPLALWIDLVWSKRRTLEVYLNVVEWGPGVFGAEAAARHWFDVPAAGLGRTQAARLAAALPNPRLRDPARPGPGTQRIARIVEARAAGAGAYVGCLEP